VAQIRKGRVGLSIGRFDSEMEAAVAYDAAARVLFGEHGHLNFRDRPSTGRAWTDARYSMGTPCRALSSPSHHAHSDHWAR
jgi:hypothetical protein